MLRVTTQWSSPGGAPYYTTLHYEGDIGTAQAVVDATRDLYVAVQGWFASAYNYTVSGEVKEVDVATNEVTAVTVVTPRTGSFTGTGTFVPLSSQVLWQWRTGQYAAGREIRGRTFIPGFTTANVSQGRIISGVVVSMTAAINTWLGAAGTDLVVYSPTRADLAAVTAGTVWNEFAVLRSRRD